MKINELIQTGTRTEEYTAIVPATYDNNGNILTETHSETQTREVPIMTAVTRDMTDEEISAMSASEAPAENPDEADAIGSFFTGLASSETNSIAKIRELAQQFLAQTGGNIG